MRLRQRVVVLYYILTLLTPELDARRVRVLSCPSLLSFVTLSRGRPGPLQSTCKRLCELCSGRTTCGRGRQLEGF
ncbi:hypothetical protein H4582DRAFT_988965 [Lactarius indigo]|nr:hypothetical protein H4582DRAFT_988965 [Lactarius indigo]